jgi:hypothetical protein
MKMRIATLAACAAMLALAQADVARAQSLLVNTTHSNIRHPGEKAKSSALQDVSTTRGRVLPGKQKGKTDPAAISDQANAGSLPKKKK